jgi:hypothetical protein
MDLYLERVFRTMHFYDEHDIHSSVAPCHVPDMGAAVTELDIGLILTIAVAITWLGEEWVVLHKTTRAAISG